MKIINGTYHMQVSDLLEDLKAFPKDSVVYCIDSSGRRDFYEHSIYKTSESADPGEVYLYLGDNKL